MVISLFLSHPLVISIARFSGTFILYSHPLVNGSRQVMVIVLSIFSTSSPIPVLSVPAGKIGFSPLAFAGGVRSSDVEVIMMSVPLYPSIGSRSEKSFKISLPSLEFCVEILYSWADNRPAKKIKIYAIILIFIVFMTFNY